MAEATGLRNNALPYPIYGVPFGVTFPMLDADGDLVTGATTPDAERSLNGDTFADCTNESTEIATNSGVYYLLLTGAEMTADVVTVIAKSATAGMKTTVLTLYPRKLVSLRTGTSQTGAAGTITLDASASAIDDYYNGCVCVAVIDSNTEARVITDYVGSTKVASVTPNWNVTPDSDDTFTIYLTEGRQIPQSDNVGWLGTALPSSDTAGYPKVTIKDGTGTGEIDTNAGAIVSVTTTGTATAVTTVNGLAANVITAASIATGAIDADALAADTITAAKVHADVTTEINAPVLAVLGALNDAAADGAVTTTDTMVAYLKQIINTLEGGPGIPTWPAAAAPGNAVSIAEALRYLYDQVGVAGAGLTAADDAVIAAIPSAATVADAVWDEDATGHQTGGTFGQAIGDPGANTETLFKAIVVDPAGTNIAADVIAIKSETAAILDDTDDIGVAGAGLTVLATQATVDAIDDILDTEFPALVTAVADLPTNAELATALGTADDAVLAQVALVKAVTDKVDDTLEDDAGTYRFTANALEEAPSGGTGLDAAGVRDAIGLATANLDTQLADIESKVDDTEGLITTVDTVVDAILVDTNELQTDWVNGGRLDLLIDAINAKTTNLPTDPADESALEALIDALPTGAENAAALLDLVNGVEAGLTPRQALRLFAAALLGKASGLETTTAVYRDTGDSKDRITATVDVDGNRSVVTLDAS
jgi:hypothetical protein